MSLRKKVLVTGAYGLVGNVIYRRLTQSPQHYDVYALARRRHPSARLPREEAQDIPDDHLSVVDLSDARAVQKAVDGMDVVVHMAADPNADASWESILANNITGSYHVFEACRLASVKRLIYASSMMVFIGYVLEEPYKSLFDEHTQRLKPADIPRLTDTSPTRPLHFYETSKVWGEGMAHMYARNYDMSCLVLRIGMVEAEEPPALPGAAFAWCSQRDIAQLAELCVNAPESLRFAIFHGLSDNDYNLADIQPARDLLGYQPQDGIRSMES
jgi:NAD+ dependent glucose-6-phosphate dehydrogenase